MKRFFTYLFFFITFTLLILFLCTPDTVQRTAHESILFCVVSVIPSLFPGFVLSDLLISLFPVSERKKNGLFSRIFLLNDNCFRCWLIGLLAGFPSAADCVCRLVESRCVSKQDGERCLAFTNNPGIVFVVCAVGSGVFGSLWIGFYLWAIQMISAVLIGIMFAVPHEDILRRNQFHRGINFKEAFPKSVSSSVSNVLNICGFIVFFRVLITVLSSAVGSDPIKILLSGLLEMTCGISCFREFSFFSAILVSVMLGWSGFSVHFQILGIVEKAGLSLKYYFVGKILQSLISAGLTAVSYLALFDDGEEHNPIFAGLFACLLLFAVLIRFRKEYLYGKGKLRARKTTARLRTELH